MQILTQPKPLKKDGLNKELINMGYITTTVEVDIDYDDLDEDDLIQALRYKLNRYVKKADSKATASYNKLKDDIADLIDEEVPERTVFTNLPDTLLEEQTVEVLKKVAKKYNLDELEALL